MGMGTSRCRRDMGRATFVVLGLDLPRSDLETESGLLANLRANHLLQELQR